jgi:hypothetical protein
VARSATGSDPGFSGEFSFAIYPETWLVRRLQALAEDVGQMKAKTTVHTSQ